MVSAPASCLKPRVSFYFICFLSLPVPAGSAPADKLLPSTLWISEGIHSIRQKAQTQIFFFFFFGNNSFSSFGFCWGGQGTLSLSCFEGACFDWDLWSTPLISRDRKPRTFWFLQSCRQRLCSRPTALTLCHTFWSKLLILASFAIAVGWEFPKSSSPGSLFV